MLLMNYKVSLISESALHFRLGHDECIYYSGVCMLYVEKK